MAISHGTTERRAGLIRVQLGFLAFELQQGSPFVFLCSRDIRNRLAPGHPAIAFVCILD